MAVQQLTEEQEARRAELARMLKKKPAAEKARDEAKAAFERERDEGAKAIAEIERGVAELHRDWRAKCNLGAYARAEQDMISLFLADESNRQLVERRDRARFDLGQLSQRVSRQRRAVKDGAEYIELIKRQSVLPSEQVEIVKKQAATEADLAALEGSLRLAQEDVQRVDREYDRRWRAFTR